MKKLFEAKQKPLVVYNPADIFMKYNMKNQEKIYEYAIKEMVGHSIKDVTESVYTVRDLEWVRNDMEKLE